MDNSMKTEEEAKAWQNEEADKALEIMGSIQEQHEEFEYQRVQRERELAKQDGGRLLSTAASRKINGCESISGVAPESPSIDIRFFSYKAWQVSVLLLLVLNGFLMTLFLDEMYEPQRHIFYDFVVVSSTLRIDLNTPSSVVETFSEVMRLRSEFAASLHQHLTPQELTIADLQEELKARDAAGSGLIEVDELRSVLEKFGFRLTRFRFNSVVTYSQVVRLEAMTENEHLVENVQAAEYPAHPLLRPSVLIYDNVGQASALSQSNYSLFASTRQLPLAQSSMKAEPHPDHFVALQRYR
ncbi:hypothetical protein PHYSODRAFT_250966 [Phytophthora sojae]|uniref:EF-hand domain-containing protein n=1 Tax=Phytophthora sojae (strain P6497) TaxID=1094619 RepID=G4ZQS4_PHYSP|nr:hypothetical protein PHYSODRAFT_250966 [Phytophthora sojae]EGZ16175.1 hypothetical protein PHYSODRAFT_250966 [Phytophthora sojae]|eukprot:XP_009529924.1 hypothetical protein PHYSODRAFT_250966 [Phytophthora sojae]